MRRLVIGTLGLGAALGIVLGLNWAALRGASEVSATPSLRDQSYGAPIHRCMNMGGALEAPNEGDWGYKIRREDFARLKQAGFDTVRVPIKFSAHTDTRPPYKIQPEFLRRIDQLVDWALLERLQIIIDVHHYEELMQAPDQHEVRLEAIWDQLARHYHRAPQQVMFELINEPNDKMDVARTDRLNARLLTRIRRDNPTRWVIVGSAGWGSSEALIQSQPPQDSRIITTFHYYDPFEVTHQGATWMEPSYPLGVRWGSQKEYQDIASHFEIVARWRDQSGHPMLLGEFGVYLKADLTTRAKWTEAVRREAEKHGMGWCYWEWGTGFPVYDLSREQWITPIRAALTSP